MLLRRSAVTGALVVLFVLAPAGAASVRSQNAISLSVVPSTVQDLGSLAITVRYTAVEDDGSAVGLLVETHPGTSDCVADPSTTAVSGAFLLQEEVSGTGSKVLAYGSAYHRPPFSAPVGTYRLCAWLEEAQDAVLAGPSSAGLTVTPAPTEQSWVGRTSQHQRFGLGTYGQTVIGFDYVETRLTCRGTHPSIPWVTWPGFADRLSIRIDARGHFAAVVTQPRGNTVSISGTFSGNRVVGSLTDTLHPVPADGIDVSAGRVTGGVCRATIRFTATHRPS